MGTDPRLNGAGSPLTLYEEVDDGRGGKSVREVVLTMHPMSDRDITELDEWVRGVYIENARRSLTPTTSKRDREETMRIAMDQAMGLSFMHSTGAKMMGTVEGVVRMLLQSCKRSHPELTVERLRALLFDKANVSRVNEKWRALNIGANPTRPPRPSTEVAKAVQGNRAQRRKVASAKTKSASTARSRKRTTSRPSK